MSCLAPADAVIMRATAAAWAPPPPPDPWDWACQHLEFSHKSPRPGRFDATAFAWAQRILECLDPEHPAREVTLCGSAQFGKTETIIIPAVACWMDRDPANVLMVHPTASAASDWAKDKWSNFRAENARMRVVFGPNAPRDSIDFQETLDRRAILYVEASGSPSGLSGKSCPRVVMDDLSKFEPNPKGDPETLANSRADAYAHGAKILRASTAMVRGDCRITRAYERGTAEQWHVPCPHCGHRHPLLWENLEPNIREDAPQDAHFTCPSCGAAIEHHDKEAMVAAGGWVAGNPDGDHPSFHFWRAYSIFRDWASIAQAWLVAKGDPGSEQTFFNDVLGLPYAAASDAPKWEALRDRVENAAEDNQTPRGRIPPQRPILTCGVDVQADRLECHIRAHGRDGRAHTVDYLVIQHPIASDEARAELDALLRRRWRATGGRDIALDMLAIDMGAWTDDVRAWSKRHPRNRVVAVKGASSGVGPIYALQKLDRRKDGRAVRARRQDYVINVSALKAMFYGALRKEDPDARGFQSFAPGLGDAFFRQLCSEARILKRNRFGVLESAWRCTEPDGRNEALDTALYAEVAARLCGSRTMTDEQWDALEAERDAAPDSAQPELFDPAPKAAVKASARAAQAATIAAAPASAPTASANPVAAAFARIKKR